MSDKENNFKEKFRQALISTSKVISDDFKPIIKNSNENVTSKNPDFLEIKNLSNKNDFTKFRAHADSIALKKKFSNLKILNKNQPNNSSCRSLYKIAEKIRYEALGGKMLKGIEKNFLKNYDQMISLKRKDQIKTKEDVLNEMDLIESTL